MADVGDREVLCFRLRGWAEMVSQLRRVACHRKTADLPGAAAAHCQVGSPFSGWSIRYLLVLGTGTCAMSHGGQCAGCITR